MRHSRMPGIRRPGGGFALLWAAVLLVPGLAEAGRVIDSDQLKLDVGGDLKGFFDVFLPYEHLLMPDDPVASAAFDFRFKVGGSYAGKLSWQFHHSTTASIGSQDALDAGWMASTRGAQHREAVDLGWTAHESASFRLGGRVDRLSLGVHVPGLDIWLGRQPMSFGTGYFFTPLDLITPYAPQVVDREYKPGVDALRFDGFIGTTGRVSVAVGAVDSLDRDGLFAVATGGFTVGLFDIDLLAAYRHEDVLVGLSTQGSLGPVGVHADLAVTLPPDPDDGDDPEAPFVRVVVGADARTGFGLSAMVEIYGQSLGTSDPSDYLSIALSDRFARGDLWTMGHLYGALSLSQEILPIVSVSLFAVVNLLDPSALLGPGLTWSVAENADFVIGGFVSLGKRPADITILDLLRPDGTPMSAEQAAAVIEPGSEFGLAGHQAYAQLKLYF